MSEATIRIQRDGGRHVDRARRYAVIVDDEVVGRIRRGESFDHRVSPGRHEVRLKIDWSGSPTVEVDIPEGGVERFRCAPAIRRGTGPFEIIAKLTSKRNTYLELERLGPPW